MPVSTPDMAKPDSPLWQAWQAWQQDPRGDSAASESYNALRLLLLREVVLQILAGAPERHRHDYLLGMRKHEEKQVTEILLADIIEHDWVTKWQQSGTAVTLEAYLRQCLKHAMGEAHRRQHPLKAGERWKTAASAVAATLADGDYRTTVAAPPWWAPVAWPDPVPLFDGALWDVARSLPVFLLPDQPVALKRVKQSVDGTFGRTSCAHLKEHFLEILQEQGAFSVFVESLDRTTDDGEESRERPAPELPEPEKSTESDLVQRLAHAERLLEQSLEPEERRLLRRVLELSVPVMMAGERPVFDGIWIALVPEFGVISKNTVRRRWVTLVQPALERACDECDLQAADERLALCERLAAGKEQPA
jgi:hypothetical protein